MADQEEVILEWAIGYRTKDGEVRITPRWYHSREEAQAWFDYLCGPWREELERKAATEDLRKTNWAHMTLMKKKQEQHLLLCREVSPYTILEEAPEWT